MFTFCKLAFIFFTTLLATASPTPHSLNVTDGFSYMNESNTLSSRLVAPPYPDACITRKDCAYGYKCFKGTCILGCDYNTDCLAHNHCTWCHSCGKFAKGCMDERNTVCGRHGAWCRYGEQCCSGICKKKGWGPKRCLPRYRHGREANEEIEAGEGEAGEGETEEIGEPGDSENL